MADDKAKLDACPHCGKEDAFVERSDLSACHVVCNECGARGPACCDETEADAAASENDDAEPGELAARRAWNTRAAPPAMDRETAKEAEFLLDRLADFEREITDDEVFTHFNGHVSPSAVRLRMYLSTLSAGPIRQGEGKYLVWSNEHHAWWGPDERGYTRIIERAGRYDRDKAFSISSKRGGGWQTESNPYEIAIPEADAIAQYTGPSPATPASHASDVGTSNA